MKRRLFLLVIYLVLSAYARAQQPNKLISIDSMELMGKVLLIQQEHVLRAINDSLKAQQATLQPWVDSLRIRANQLALRHNYMVRKVDRKEDELISSHYELKKIDKTLDRHARWLDRYYRRANFVHYRYFYPKRRDRVAKWYWILGNVALGAKLTYDFTQP